MNVHEWISTPESRLITYLIYAGICASLSILFALMLPRRFQKTYFFNFLLFFFLSTSLFMIGILVSLSLFFAIYVLHFSKNPYSEFELAEVPDYQRAPQFQAIHFGEASGPKLIQNDDISKEIRETMLIAINRFHTASVNRINKSLLSDDVDELRLYAQGLLEMQERDLFKLLSHLNLLLEKATDSETKAFLEKHIAQLLWEQIYKGLVDEESISGTLEKTRLLSEHAFGILKKDTALPLLLTLIALRQKKLDSAKEWLACAKKNNASYYRTALFEAEIAFHQQDYAQAKRSLSSIVHKGVIGAESILLFWSQG